MMVGSLADTSDDVDPDNHATTPTFAEIEEYSAGALTRFPILEEGAAQGGWAGLYDVTPTGSRSSIAFHTSRASTASSG